MEPLAALGLAAAVVQFTDFGTHILADSVRIYRSVNGQTSQHVQLATISQDLQELAVNIQAKSKTIHQPGRPLKPTERLLVRLSEDCQEISSQLNNALSRLKADRTSSSSINLMKKSIAAAIRTCCSKSQIADLQRSLSEIRQQMMMTSLTILWFVASFLGIQGYLRSSSGADSFLKRREESAQQAGMRETLDRIDLATRKLNPTVVKLSQIEPSPTNKSPESALVNAIWNSTWTTTGSIASMMESTSYVDAVRGFTQADEGGIFDPHEADMFSTLSIINSLVFEKFKSRETAIPKAYKSTFKWAFKEPSGNAQWANFDQWLRDNQTQIYWITGKAGAGKSTLMKYLSSHPRTRARLEAWSEPLPLVLASFYFWIAGDSMEKSQEGLLQTLLYQFLCQMPHLTPKVCPRRWALFKLFGNKALKVAPAWSFDELLESLSVVERYVGTEFNLCLFVDGLDEFDGDLGNLISLIKLFHARSGAKVCVSSRPWNAFSDAFRENPSLRLQDLTKNDMKIYVKAHFLSNQGFKELQQSSPTEAQQLMDQVVTKAEGIFLWLSVVVRSLLEGLTDGDRLSDLQQTVDSLPSDLSELYQQIWLRIKPAQRRHFSRYFQIHHTSLQLLDAVTLWMADNDKAMEFEIDSLSEETTEHITQMMSRRLNSKTRGLLEISPEGYVDFLHRTVRDWVKSIWSDICAQSPPDFDPNLELLKANVVCLFRNQPKSPRLDIRRRMKACLKYAAQTRGIGSNTPLLVACLDKFDRDLVAHGSNDYLGEFQPKNWNVGRQSPVLQYGSPHYTCITILGLAAQKHILPYVRHKVVSDPTVLQHEGDGGLSILGCAIFGFDYLTGDGRSAGKARVGDAERYEIVRLLLENGALRLSKFEPTPVFRQRNWACIGWDVYKRIKLNRRHAGPIPFRKLNGEKYPDYWKAMQELYEGCPDFKRWKWSRYLSYKLRGRSEFPVGDARV